MTTAPTQPMPAASVGVATAPTMLPSTTMTSTSGGTMEWAEHAQFLGGSVFGFRLGRAVLGLDAAEDGDVEDVEPREQEARAEGRGI